MYRASKALHLPEILSQAYMASLSSSSWMISTSSGDDKDTLCGSNIGLFWPMAELRRECKDEILREVVGVLVPSSDVLLWRLGVLVCA